MGAVRKRVVGPSVRGDLVTFSDHTFDQVWVRSRDINFSFSVIVSRDEERRLEPV